MNARTLIAWLGLSSAATVADPAPVTLAADMAPATIAPASSPLEAGAAPDLAAESAEQPESGVAALKVIANELAGVEAHLLAVNRQLDAAANVKSPELDAPAEPPGSVPLDYESFCAKLCEFAKATGKPLTFAAPPKADFDKQVKEETAALIHQNDRDELLALRRKLDVQQAALWARLTCGTFASRDIASQPLYVYTLKPSPPGGKNAGTDEVLLSKGRVLEAAVNAMRRIDLTLTRAAAALKAGNDDPEGPNLVAALHDGASQACVQDAIIALRQEVNKAKSVAGLLDSEKIIFDELGEDAQGVREGIGAATNLSQQSSKVSGETARTRNRAQLQAVLLDVGDKASRLDKSLLARSEEWTAGISGNRLPGLASTVSSVAPAKDAHPQPQDAVSKQLSDKRVGYEKEIEEVRKSIQAELAKTIRASRDPDVRTRVKTQLDAFTTRGEWPDGITFEDDSDKAARASQNMLKAYDDAFNICFNAKNEPLAASIKLERDRFQKQNDLIPWKDQLPKGAAPRLADGKAVVVCEISLPLNYRIEVEGKRTAGDGPLLMEVPGSSGKSKIVEILPDVKGDVHMMLTACENGLSADLGLIRPLPEATTPGEARSVTFRAVSGTFEVKTVRWKPVIEGRPRTLDDSIKARAARLSSELTEGSEWSGMCEHRWIQKVGPGNIAPRGQETWKIGRRDQAEVVIEGTGTGGKRRTWTLHVDGDRLTVTAMTRSSGRYDNVTGSGTIRGKHLQFSYKASASTGDGDTVDGKFDLTKK